jgi:hypothetical protein
VSAEENQSSRSAKGKSLRPAHPDPSRASRREKKGSHFQALFRRFLPRQGCNGAIWAIAHRLGRLVWKILHDGVRYVEQGQEPDPKAKQRRTKKLLQALRKLGYTVTLTATASEPAR